MKSLVFEFRNGVPLARQRAVLDKIGAWDSVASAGLLKPDHANPIVRRTAFVYVADNGDFEDVSTRLAGIPEIKRAERPAVRGL